jgi:hypothetical protein
LLARIDQRTALMIGSPSDIAHARKDDGRLRFIYYCCIKKCAPFIGQNDVTGFAALPHPNSKDSDVRIEVIDLQCPNFAVATSSEKSSKNHLPEARIGCIQEPNAFVFGKIADDRRMNIMERPDTAPSIVACYFAVAPSVV